MIVNGESYSWTQPICEDDFSTLFPKVVDPHRVKLVESEKCCYCGLVTTSGLYIRVNPSTVAYPS